MASSSLTTAAGGGGGSRTGCDCRAEKHPLIRSNDTPTTDGVDARTEVSDTVTGSPAHRQAGTEDTTHIDCR